MIPFFEEKQMVYYTLCLLIIPLVCGLIFYLYKNKYVWIMSLIIIISSIIITGLFYPYYIVDIIKSEYDSTTVYWAMFFVPLIIMDSIIASVVVKLLLKNTKK